MKFQLKDLYEKNKKIVWFLICVFTVKLLLAGFFSSDYQNLMFIPFIEHFIDNLKDGLSNPYQTWYLLKTGVSFPYQFVMILIESIGMFLIKIFDVDSIFLTNLLFKLPIIVFDLIGLIFLFKIFPRRKKEISILYYTSPIVLYSSYIHSQLDIIPIVILIISIYYLITGNKKKNLLFALFLGIAIMTKHSIMIVVPILFIYLYKKDGLLEAIKAFFITFSIILLFSLPFLSDGYINNVLFNVEQSVILNCYMDYGRVRVYISLVVLFIVYLNAFVIASINKDLLFGYCAICFSVFVALIPPMPAWFVWILPFMVSIIAAERVKNKEKVMQVYYLFNILYLIYVIFCHSTQYTDMIFLTTELDFIKINNPEIVNIIFTLFESVLLYFIFILYKNGLESNSLYKRKNTPFIIGISGDSGAGKSTLVSVVHDMFKREKILLIEGDGDHKWERNEKMWEQYTHLNPKANFLYRQAKNIEQLRNGFKVKRVDYNHETGKFSEVYQIKQKKYIILNGLHTLYLPQLRDNLDLKIYMDTEEKLKIFWKIRRDANVRGHSISSTLKSIEQRNKDYKKYIEPQKKYADLIITYFDDKLKPEHYGSDYQEKVSLKFTFSSSIDLEPIVSYLESYGIVAEHDFSKNLEMQTIVFDFNHYNVAEVDFNKILENVIYQPEELSISTKKLKNNQEGLIKLIMIGIINQKLVERE